MLEDPADAARDAGEIEVRGVRFCVGVGMYDRFFIIY